MNIIIKQKAGRSHRKISVLVNRSRVLRGPSDKKGLDAAYYAQGNYQPVTLPLDSVCEQTLLEGHHVVPGVFKKEKRGFRRSENWRGQNLFLIEFDENIEESTLEAFIEARPFLAENAWFVMETLRSRYEDPEDVKCKGQLRVRVVFCLPAPVETLQERKWICEALIRVLPGCDTGSAVSATTRGLGRSGAPL